MGGGKRHKEGGEQSDQEKQEETVRRTRPTDGHTIHGIQLTVLRRTGAAKWRNRFGAVLLSKK